MRPLLPKIIALRNYPKPRTRNQLRSFLGLSNYYGKFIKQYADKAKPLHEALNKGEPDQVVWTEERVQSFQILKEALTENAVLFAPQMDKLSTNASGTGLGAILSQEDQEGQERPVVYYSKELSKAERNYSATELEVLLLL